MQSLVENVDDFGQSVFLLLLRRNKVEYPPEIGILSVTMGGAVFHDIRDGWGTEGVVEVFNHL